MSATRHALAAGIAAGWRRRAWLGTIREYLALTRPRVTLTAVLTAVPALAIGRDGWPPATTALSVLAGITLLASGCSAVNAWCERDRDALMARTRHRPLPAGRLPAGRALAFGILATLYGLAILGLAGSALAAALGGLTFAWYIGLYTLWAKPSSPWNVVVGAVPGAAAPLIADAAVSGQVGPWAWALFAIVFLWQPPHVWAIALFRRDDQAAAGLPSLPQVRGEDATRAQMLGWTLALVLASLLPARGGALGPLYGVVAAGAGAYFVRAVALAIRERAPRADRRAFGASLVHLTLLFSAMLVELGLR